MATSAAEAAVGIEPLTYQEVLDRDPGPVPAVLRLQSMPPMSDADIPISRYTSAEWHRREVERLWKRVWQFACREEDIPRPGDYFVYEIARLSYVVVRDRSGTVRAYVNSCLHRGRRLKDDEGHCSTLRCPFHGFAWSLDGKLLDIPGGWDFGHVDAAAFSLPEARVGVWAGFVFINPDVEAPPFEEFIEELATQFSGWDLGNMYKEAHLAKVIPANWKVAQEAFSESYHVGRTHPQTMTYVGDTNCQVDVWDNCARVISPGGVPSPMVRQRPSEEAMLRAMLDVRSDRPLNLQIPEGQTMRAFAAGLARERLRPSVGDAIDLVSDAEMMDSIDYTLFPNFHPWGAYNKLVFRFRPNGDDHRSSIMDVIFLSPFAGDRPPPAPTRWLGQDEPWTKAPELGLLGKVFEQDTFNMANVQRGLEASVKPGITLGHYMEAKVRWLHDKLTEWVGADEV